MLIVCRMRVSLSLLVCGPLTCRANEKHDFSLSGLKITE